MREHLSTTSTASRRMIGDQAFATMLLAPTFVFILCLALWPIARIIWLSFQQQDLDTALRVRPTGMSNYIRVFNDGRYWQSIRNTFTFAFIAVSVELLLGLGLALLLNQSFRGRSIARAAALIPWALPTAVLALAWLLIFNAQYGVFNDLLLRIGLIREKIA